MATTKIWDYRDDLSELVNYVVNPKKTEQGLYAVGVNCQPDTATSEMNIVKQRWNKTGGSIAFHCIQNFKPGEATPEQAHKIGIAFAEKMWGDGFQVVVGTHLDRGHLHNHFVVNSVSFVDGKRYYDNKQTYYGRIRKISDDLCREYGLSVIEHPKGHGKSYREHMNEKAGEPTVRDLIRTDIDEVLPRCLIFQHFLDGMRERGYSIRYDPTIQRPGIKPPGQKHHCRFYKMGEGYTIEDIKARIARQLDGIVQEAQPPASTQHIRPPRRYRCTTPIPRQRSRPLVGMPALTVHYLYVLGKVKRRKTPTRATYALRGELAKLRRYQEQFVFLHRHGITKLFELNAWEQRAHETITSLTKARAPLYRARKAAPDEASADAITAQIMAANNELKQWRKTVRICRNARADTPIMQRAIRRVEEIERGPQRGLDREKENLQER